jgi:hypothetical protein
MSQRSPYNDRNKVEQKGKTRKSASSAKPKRAVADLTPTDTPKKKAVKKTSAWGRAKAAWAAGGPSSPSYVPPTPRMKQLRRIWWALWGGALVIALVIVLMQQAKMGSPALVGVLWVFWLAAMGGAFFLEFGPIRKERALLIETTRSSGKSEKAAKADKPAKAAKTEPPVPDDRQPPSPEDPA